MKRLLLILYTLFICNNLNAQDLPTIIPPSPNASALGSYGQIPVGKFTGTPNINIPLYTINNGNLSIPLSLSYNSNGIKVDQLSTDVGLGWSLNAGGVITRILRDEADENHRVNMPDVSLSSEEMNSFLFSTIISDGMDTQPDLFAFNFNGFLGKFFLNDNLNPTLINPAPLKIEMMVNSTFKITDSSGIIYFFGEGNSYEESASRTYGVGDGSQNIITEPIKTAWYLSKIRLLNGEEILFSYDIGNVIYDIGISQSISASKKHNLLTNGGYPYYTNASHELPVITKQFSTLAILDTIQWNDGYVKFNYSQRYSDLSTQSQFKKLDSIIVFNKHNYLIKKIDLSYRQYSTVSSFQNPDNNGIDPTNAKRLFLDEVVFFPGLIGGNQKYSFEYNNPDQMPPRLSYAQDYWGYFNGKNNSDLVSDDISLYNPTSYDEPELSYNLLVGLFNNVGGNKSPNANFGINGLLKKITYPTGGFNEFLYEPNSYYGIEAIPTGLVPLSINIHTVAGNLVNSQSVTTDIIPYEQKRKQITFSMDALSCWEIGWPDHKKKAILTVNVAPNNSNIFSCPETNEGFYGLDINGQPTYGNGGCSIEAFPEVFNQYYIDLKEGYKYKFTVTLNWECLRGDFGFSYYNQTSQIINTNIEVGGLRIQKIISNNGKGNEEVKKYHYGDLNCLDCSSGELEVIRPAISFKTYDFFDSNLAQSIETIATLSSGSLRPLYDSQGYHISYKSVIEEIGENYEGGGTLFEFKTVFDNLPEVFGDNIPGTSYSNGFGNGNELKTTLFKLNGNEYIKSREILYNYKVNDYRLNNSIKGFTTSIRRHFSAPVSINEMTYGSNFYTFNLNKFNINSQWHYLESTTEKQYDQNGQDPVTTTSNYFYDNAEHLQVTRTTVTTSDGKEVQTNTYYPNDKSLLIGLSNESNIAIDSLISQHRIAEPIQVKNYKKEGAIEALLSTQRISFGDWGSNFTNTANIIRPDTIQISKRNNALENRIIYHKYDNKGNPTEVSKQDGTPIVYIWGYLQTQPIAKVENATYAQVSSHVSTLQSLSDADNDNTINEGALRTALNNLRIALPNAMVTSYTYDPLIGVTSITDANGETIYYHYDNFNRLEYVKDAQGKILSKNEYHYKNQQ